MDGRTVTFGLLLLPLLLVGVALALCARIETKICRGEDSSSQYCRRSMSGRKQGLYWYAGVQFSVKFLQSTSSLVRSLASSVVLRGLLSVSVSGGELGFFFWSKKKIGEEEEEKEFGGGSKMGLYCRIGFVLQLHPPWIWILD